MSIIADFAVPGGPTITMCSPAIAEIVISRTISCLSRNCAPIWRASSWNAADPRATSTAKLRGVVGGATIWAHLNRKQFGGDSVSTAMRIGYGHVAVVPDRVGSAT